MKRLFGALLALVFICAAVAPAGAQVGEPPVRGVTSGGVMLTLASAVAATANQAFTSSALGRPKSVTLCMSASAATTFSVTESPDGTTYYAASLPDATTSANYAPAGAGTICETVAPASYIKVATSAANTVTIQLQASY